MINWIRIVEDLTILALRGISNYQAQRPAVSHSEARNDDDGEGGEDFHSYMRKMGRKFGLRITNKAKNTVTFAVSPDDETPYRLVVAHNGNVIRFCVPGRLTFESGGLPRDYEAAAKKYSRKSRSLELLTMDDGDTAFFYVVGGCPAASMTPHVFQTFAKELVSVMYKFDNLLIDEGYGE